MGYTNIVEYIQLARIMSNFKYPNVRDRYVRSLPWLLDDTLRLTTTRHTDRLQEMFCITEISSVYEPCIAYIYKIFSPIGSVLL